MPEISFRAVKSHDTPMSFQSLLSWLLQGQQQKLPPAWWLSKILRGSQWSLPSSPGLRAREAVDEGTDASEDHPRKEISRFSHIGAVRSRGTSTSTKNRAANRCPSLVKTLTPISSPFDAFIVPYRTSRAWLSEFMLRETYRGIRLKPAPEASAFSSVTPLIRWRKESKHHPHPHLQKPHSAFSLLSSGSEGGTDRRSKTTCGCAATYLSATVPSSRTPGIAYFLCSRPSFK